MLSLTRTSRLACGVITVDVVDSVTVAINMVVSVVATTVSVVVVDVSKSTSVSVEVY